MRFDCNGATEAIQRSRPQVGRRPGQPHGPPDVRSLSPLPRAAVAAALGLLPELPLIAGGKSFGGRMTSQAQAKACPQGVYGLAFLGFPLHPAGRPSQDRAQHLFDVEIPMLFLQGTRDRLASLDQLEPLCKKLGRPAKTVCGRRSFLSCAGADRPEGSSGSWRRA
ncbi:MAG: alpha/beta family hydrolase [Pseudolabrys sp.]|jgi:predicted alpha/beta-hydrolase family hydrolase